jgi:hypothetical protein
MVRQAAGMPFAYRCGHTHVGMRLNLDLATWTTNSERSGRRMLGTGAKSGVLTSGF